MPHWITSVTKQRVDFHFQNLSCCFYLKFCIKENIILSLPEKNLTGDNALMIGSVAIIKILNQKLFTRLEDIIAVSNFSVEEI